MEFKNIFDIIFHIGDFLKAFAQDQNVLCYVVIAVIIFFETGFVVTPFLPGDSLLFTVGALAATGVMQLGIAIPILGLAAVTGDTTNYFIGRFLGKKLFTKEKSIFFNKKYLTKTETFYEKHGRITIIIARYIPIIRTFAPFVAGIGRMKYGRFITFSLIGGFAWVSIISLLGFLFGNLPIIKDNFSLVLIFIIIISVTPPIVAAIRAFISNKKKKQTAE